MPGFRSYHFLARLLEWDGATRTDLRVAICLLRHANGSGTCWPGNPTLARAVGHQRTGHVRSSLKRLEDQGLIARDHREKGGGFRLVGGAPVQGHGDAPEQEHGGAPTPDHEGAPAQGHQKYQEKKKNKEPTNSGIVVANLSGRPNPTEGNDLLDDDDLPLDLARDRFTYVLTVEPTRSGKRHLVQFGNGQDALIRNPVIARRLASRIGQAVVPELEIGDGRYPAMVTNFRPAPSDDERRDRIYAEVNSLVSDIAFGRGDAEAHEEALLSVLNGALELIPDAIERLKTFVATVASEARTRDVHGRLVCILGRLGASDDELSSIKFVDRVSEVGTHPAASVPETESSGPQSTRSDGAETHHAVAWDIDELIKVIDEE